MRNFPTTCRPI